MIKEEMKYQTMIERETGNLDIPLKGLNKTISFESFKDIFDRKFNHTLFAKDISKSGIFNALVFITFSINFAEFAISQFHAEMGLMPVLCIILITGLSSFYIQSSIVSYIRNIKNKQGTYSAFIHQHFGSFAALLFDILVFFWFTSNLMYALFTILNYISAIPHVEEYYMCFWLTPIICLIFVLHHRMTSPCIIYFNIYFSILLNIVYIIIAIVFLSIEYNSNPSYFTGESYIQWNIRFEHLNMLSCLQAFSVFSFGLSNAMLVFLVVNQYSGIAFSNKRYYQMGVIYSLVVLYFIVLGVIDIYLTDLDLRNMINDPMYEGKYLVWKWVFRAIYFFRQLTELSYMFWFLTRLIFRENIRLLLQHKRYYFSIYSVLLFVFASLSVLIQRKIIRGLEYFSPKYYSLISNGIIGVLLNFFLPILIYMKLSEKKLGNVRMIAKVIICYLFCLCAFSYFYNNVAFP